MARTICTYHSYGFTLTLLLLLALAEVATIVQVSLEYFALSEYIAFNGDQTSLPV
jgi:hypothetical protein